MFGKILISVFTLFVMGSQSKEHVQSSPLVTFLKEYLEIKYVDKSFDHFIYIAAKSQKLYVINGSAAVQVYSISTSKNGLGSTRGSFKTPEGLHKIAEKIGQGIPIRTIISHKVPTNNLAETISKPQSNNQDLITSRVFHLKGLEPGLNSGEGHDSYNRGIFIHGTHEEGLLGTPASKGCIRMSNKDVIELFENVEVGTFVIILNN